MGETDMKYLKQFAVILSVTCIGEIMHYFIPLPIPGSVYGLVLLFLALIKGWIKVEAVRETGLFLIEIMPLMFIPAAAGIVVSWGHVRTMLVPACVVTVASTFIVMVIAGKVTDACISRQEKGEEKRVGECDS